MEKLGGRKFVAFLICLAVGMAIEILGKNGVSSNMMTLILGLLASFSASNVATTLSSHKLESVINSKDDSIEAEPVISAPAVIDDSRVTALETDTKLLKEQNQMLLDAVTNLQKLAQAIMKQQHQQQ